MEKKKMTNKRTCVLCGEEVIPAKNNLCKECYIKYKQYIPTDWFKELQRMQRRQDVISDKESFRLFDYYPYHEVQPSQKNPGRQQKHSNKTIKMILHFYDDAMEEYYHRAELSPKTKEPQVTVLAKQQNIVRPSTFIYYIKKYRTKKQEKE
jgi:hypothetical protein